MTKKELKMLMQLQKGFLLEFGFSGDDADNIIKAYYAQTKKQL